ncbi:MAG: SDR family oxidoreductase [Mangrovibacterium sp.]
MQKIMITGATGHLGSQVLQLLVQRAGNESLSAIARDPSKLASFKSQGVNVIQADYDDKGSLLKAFSGIDILYFVSGNDIHKRREQHENVVNAAKEAGVKHVVYTSFQRKTETGNSPIEPVAAVHLQTEKWLRESGLIYTILKHALYTEYIPVFIGQDVIGKGIIYQPAGDGKVSFATRSDMAEAATVILTTEGHENKTYEIAGVKSYSYGDIAKILSDLSGKQITYISPIAQEFRKNLSDAGVPAAVIEVAAMFSEGIRQGEFDFPDPALQKLIGREPQSVEDYLKTVYA